MKIEETKSYLVHLLCEVEQTMNNSCNHALIRRVNDKEMLIQEPIPIHPISATEFEMKIKPQDLEYLQKTEESLHDNLEALIVKLKSRCMKRFKDEGNKGKHKKHPGKKGVKGKQGLKKGGGKKRLNEVERIERRNLNRFLRKEKRRLEKLRKEKKNPMVKLNVLLPGSTFELNSGFESLELKTAYQTDNV